MSRDYPDEPAGEFPRPPRTVTDREGREVELLAADGADHDGVFEMYVSFDPADRAQGIPPTSESAVRDWVGRVLDEDCWNVVALARASEAAVGHVTLVPDGDAHELAIFVLQSHQGAGIGTELLRTALGYGASHGVDRVWLTVERWNSAAVALYKKTGFETSEGGSFELEMTLCLDPGSAQTERTG